jgi:hypothetical protein
MNIKELAIRGLLQQHGKEHLWETCEDLIRDLVELGEEFACDHESSPAYEKDDGSLSEEILDEIRKHTIKLPPFNPYDYWNRPIGDKSCTPIKNPYQIGDFPDVICDNGEVNVQ